MIEIILSVSLFIFSASVLVSISIVNVLIKKSETEKKLLISQNELEKNKLEKENIENRKKVLELEKEYLDEIKNKESEMKLDPVSAIFKTKEEIER